MAADLQIFTNPVFGQIRTITVDGTTTFAGKDVAIALGYKDPVNAIKLHCRGVAKYHPSSIALDAPSKPASLPRVMFIG